MNVTSIQRLVREVVPMKVTFAGPLEWQEDGTGINKVV